MRAWKGIRQTLVRRIFPYIALRGKSLRRPTTILALIIAPVIMGLFALFAIPSSFVPPDTGDSLANVILLYFIFISFILPLQLALSAITVIDIMGGSDKHLEDLNLISSIPIRHTDIILSNNVLGLITVQLQFIILNVIIIFMNPYFGISSESIALFASACIGSLCLASLIVSVTALILEIGSSTISYILVPMVFIYWQTFQLIFVDKDVITWVNFFIPGTVIQLMLVVIFGASAIESVKLIFYPLEDPLYYMSQAGVIFVYLAIACVILALLFGWARKYFLKCIC